MGKFIVFGDLNGQLSDAFGKLAKLHAKQDFSFALIVGNLFSGDLSDGPESEQQELAKLLKGDIEVPVTTYFSLGNRALPTAVIEKLTTNEGELCPNLFILGRKVSIQTSDGFKIVAIGGQYAQSRDDEMNEYACTYTDKDVENAKDFKEADILVTSDWPAGVLHGSKKLADPPSSIASLGDLVCTLKPRYHLSTSEVSFTREAFFHPGPPPRPITYFVSLAPYGNSRKDKAMAAYGFDPSEPPSERLDPDTTASPFVGQNKRKLESQQDSYDSYRYANANGSGYHDHDHRRNKRRRHQPNSRECFFCLANRSVETHMITSIGDEAYLAIAKGALSNVNTFPTLKNPCHILIIPMEHKPTFAAIETEEARTKTRNEMKRYRDSLHSLISAKSSIGDDGEAQLGAVTWEISKSDGVHLHWQFLPMPVDFINKNMIEAAFDVEAEHQKYEKFAKTEKEMAEAEEGDYFKAMIWSESKEKEIVLPLPKGTKFDLQFGRRVLGKLLGLESRAHWKDCQRTQQDEAADADQFKQMFKRYDFALVEGEE